MRSGYTGYPGVNSLMLLGMLYIGVFYTAIVRKTSGHALEIGEGRVGCT